MKKTFHFWLIAFAITLVTAYYQRVTGPTYPRSGQVQLMNREIEYKFKTSENTDTDLFVEVQVDDSQIIGYLYWKRHNTDEKFRQVRMVSGLGKLSAKIPAQPPAGKIDYFVRIAKGNQEAQLPEGEPVVVRFKNPVPNWILIPHIFVMFFAMMLSTRTGLEYFNKNPKPVKLTQWTLGVLFVGGFILGPIMQKYAFGEFWTGIPFGHDLTDNKTLIAFAGWLVALFMYKRSTKPKLWALIAAIVLMLVYLIPHSVLGSELDYGKITPDQIQLENSINQ